MAHEIAAGEFKAKCLSILDEVNATREPVDGCRLPGVFHADPADRLIVATARQVECPLVTADDGILTYASTGHLKVVNAEA